MSNYRFSFFFFIMNSFVVAMLISASAEPQDTVQKRLSPEDLQEVVQVWIQKICHAGYLGIWDRNKKSLVRSLAYSILTDDAPLMRKTPFCIKDVAKEKWYFITNEDYGEIQDRIQMHLFKRCYYEPSDDDTPPRWVVAFGTAGGQDFCRQLDARPTVVGRSPQGGALDENLRELLQQNNWDTKISVDRDMLGLSKRGAIATRIFDRHGSLKETGPNVAAHDDKRHDGKGVLPFSSVAVPQSAAQESQLPSRGLRQWARALFRRDTESTALVPTDHRTRREKADAAGFFEALHHGWKKFKRGLFGVTEPVPVLDRAPSPETPDERIAAFVRSEREGVAIESIVIGGFYVRSMPHEVGCNNAALLDGEKLMWRAFTREDWATLHLNERRLLMVFNCNKAEAYRLKKQMMRAKLQSLMNSSRCQRLRGNKVSDAVVEAVLMIETTAAARGYYKPYLQGGEGREIPVTSLLRGMIVGTEIDEHGARYYLLRNHRGGSLRLYRDDFILMEQYKEQWLPSFGDDTIRRPAGNLHWYEPGSGRKRTIYGSVPNLITMSGAENHIDPAQPDVSASKFVSPAFVSPFIKSPQDFVRSSLSSRCRDMLDDKGGPQAV